MILSSRFLPFGSWTLTVSFFLRPSSALPTGDSFESRFCDGSASVEPTIVYLSDLPELSSLTDTSEPTRTTSDVSSDASITVAERIKEAREFGDISENSEYDDAKNEQALLEARIAALEDKLRSASVINASELDSDVVRVGSLVHVKDEETGKSLKYTIVGSTEADPSESKLSNESPVGKALLGRKRNEVVSVQLPNGKARELKITKIDVAVA